MVGVPFQVGVGTSCGHLEHDQGWEWEHMSGVEVIESRMVI